MALIFGEIKYVSTRAYNEVEEESDDHHQMYNVSFKLPEDVQSHLAKCKVFILSQGLLANDFLETAIASNVRDIGTVSVTKNLSINPEDTGDFHSSQAHESHLLLTDQNVLLFVAGPDVVSETCSNIGREVLSLVPRDCQIVVLSSHHYSKLVGAYSPHEDEECVIFSLASHAFLPHKPVYPSLPQPATVDGLSAAVLTECIVSKRPCVMYSAYTETFSTAEVDIVASPLARIFDAEPFVGKVTVDLSKQRLCTYRGKNPRGVTFDQYI